MELSDRERAICFVAVIRFMNDQKKLSDTFLLDKTTIAIMGELKEMEELSRKLVKRDGNGRKD